MGRTHAPKILKEAESPDDSRNTMGKETREHYAYQRLSLRIPIICKFTCVPCLVCARVATTLALRRRFTCPLWP